MKEQDLWKFGNFTLEQSAKFKVNAYPTQCPALRITSSDVH
jgi:hypothetical protein